MAIIGIAFVIFAAGVIFSLSNRNHHAFRSSLSSLFHPITPTPTSKPIVTPAPLGSLKLPIVMFHYVEYVQNSGDTLRMKLDTSPLVFDFELKALKDNNYQTYFVRDIPAILKSGNVPTQKSIVLTFDDGYEDFYQNVFPLLKKYQFKATIYIIANFIGRPGFMTESQIQELVNSGIIELGAHTLTHPSLKSIPIDVAKIQIFGSKQKLEELFHVPVTTFAYPGGSYNDVVVEFVKEASFSAALTTKPGVTLFADHLFELPRIRPGFLTIPLIKSYFAKLFFK